MCLFLAVMMYNVGLNPLILLKTYGLHSLNTWRLLRETVWMFSGRKGEWVGVNCRECHVFPLCFFFCTGIPNMWQVTSHPRFHFQLLMSLTLAPLTLAPRGCICLYPVTRSNRWCLHRELYYPPTPSCPVIYTLTGVHVALLMPPGLETFCSVAQSVGSLFG